MDSNWQRGHGYYNSKDHKKPLTRGEFFELVQGHIEMVKEARYQVYLQSWNLYHPKEVEE